MDHSYFRDKVSAYHDRELPAQEQEMLAQHVASCPECQKLLADLERLDQLVANKIELGQSDYWERNAQKIEAKLGFGQETIITPVPKSGWEKGMVWKLSAVAASVALLVFIGINKDEILKRSEPTVLQEQTDKVQVKTADTPSAKDSRLSTEADSTAIKGNSEERREPQETAADDESAAGETVLRSKEKQESVVPREMKVVEDSATQRLPVQPQVTVQKLAPPQSVPEAMQKQAAPVAAGKVPDMSEDEVETELLAQQPAAEKLAQANSTELVRWRTVCDSLSKIIEKPKESMMSKYGVNSLRTDSKKKASADMSSKDASGARVLYLESCFQIARLTDDLSEYTDSKEVLEFEAKSSDSTLAATARSFLDRLAAERPTPPQK